MRTPFVGTNLIPMTKMQTGKDGGCMSAMWASHRFWSKNHRFLSKNWDVMTLDKSDAWSVKWYKSYSWGKRI